MSQLTPLSIKTAAISCLRTAESELDKTVPDILSDIEKKLEINETDKTTVTVSLKCKLTCTKQDGVDATVKWDWGRPKLCDEVPAGKHGDGPELIARCEICRGEGCDTCKGTGCVDPTREPEPTPPKAAKKPRTSRAPKKA